MTDGLEACESSPLFALDQILVYLARLCLPLGCTKSHSGVALCRILDTYIFTPSQTLHRLGESQRIHLRFPDRYYGSQ